MITSDNNESWNKCYLCGSYNKKTLYKDKKICKCEDCKFVFYEIIPSISVLNKVYSNYTREEYITDISRQKIKVELSKILETHNISDILDIACGECYMLDALKEINPKLNLFATEHETTKQNVINKGYKFLEGDFFPKTDIKFDLIILTEAIEHINDVNAFLEHVYKILKPGGLIYMTTPNFSCLERLIMGSKWTMLDPPEHLSYFSPKTLNKALVNKNFTKVFNRTENISIFTIVEFYNGYIKNSSEHSESKETSPQNISDKLQSATSSSFLLRLLKNMINLMLGVFNLGSSLKVLYKKPS